MASRSRGARVAATRGGLLSPCPRASQHSLLGAPVVAVRPMYSPHPLLSLSTRPPTDVAASGSGPTFMSGPFAAPGWLASRPRVFQVACQRRVTWRQRATHRERQDACSVQPPGGGTDCPADGWTGSSRSGLLPRSAVTSRWGSRGRASEWLPRRGVSPTQPAHGTSRRRGRIGADSGAGTWRAFVVLLVPPSASRAARTPPPGLRASPHRALMPDRPTANGPRLCWACLHTPFRMRPLLSGPHHRPPCSWLAVGLLLLAGGEWITRTE